MEGLLEFAKGPMFRFAFAVLILGLIRLVVLAVINGMDAKTKAADKALPMEYVKKLTFGFLIPIRAFRVKPLYSFVSIVFHIGLLITPLFLFDHLLLFENAVGFSWLGLAISKGVADYLTLLTMVSAIALLIMRIGNESSRALSRKQDYFWLIMLSIPFATGYICSNLVSNPSVYEAMILTHIISGNLIFILLPFTKLAHSVLMPISQWISARSWKFAPQAGEQVCATLGKEGEKL